MKRLLVVTKMEQKLSSFKHLPSQGSNRGYSPTQLIFSFWLNIWAGANRFIHFEVLRQDKVLQKLFGWKQMAGHKVFQRYFNKFTQATNQEVFQELYSYFFHQLQFDRYTLDFDSTILTRYGEQQGAEKGYNPKKKGRNSHHPLMAFVADCRMVANFWLRSGNTSSSSNFEAFLLDTLSKLEGKKVGLIRMDSGFYAQNIFKLMEKEGLNYIVAVRLHKP